MREERATIYFAKLPYGDEIIGIRAGETGYYKVKDVNATHAMLLNIKLGWEPVDVEAAVLCSMFDLWEGYDEIVKELSRENWTWQEVLGATGPIH